MGGQEEQNEGRQSASIQSSHLTFSLAPTTVSLLLSSQFEMNSLGRTWLGVLPAHFDHIICFKWDRIRLRGHAVDRLKVRGREWEEDRAASSCHSSGAGRKVGRHYPILFPLSVGEKRSESWLKWLNVQSPRREWQTDVGTGHCCSPPHMPLRAGVLVSITAQRTLEYTAVL